MREKTKIVYKTLVKMMKPENNRFNYAVGEPTPLDTELRLYAKNLQISDLESSIPDELDGLNSINKKGGIMHKFKQDLYISGLGCLTSLVSMPVIFYNPDLSKNLSQIGGVLLLSGILKFSYDSLKGISCDIVRDNFLMVKSVRSLSGN